MSAQIPNENGYHKLKSGLIAYNGRKNLTEWDYMILAMAWKESTFKVNGNVVSPSGKYKGNLQIGAQYVKQVNKDNGTKFTHNDMYAWGNTLKVFHLMNEKKNPNKNIDKALRIHNPHASYHIDVKRKMTKIKEYERKRNNG